MKEVARIDAKLEEGRIPLSLARFLASGKALWFWVTVSSASTLLLVIFFPPTSSHSLVILSRQLLGMVFFFLSPGFSFMKAVLPSRSSLTESTVFSMAFSFALTSIVGFILNYTWVGITTRSTILGLYLLTIAFSIAGILREYGESQKATGARTGE